MPIPAGPAADLRPVLADADKLPGLLDDLVDGVRQRALQHDLSAGTTRSRKPRAHAGRSRGRDPMGRIQPGDDSTVAAGKAGDFLSVPAVFDISPDDAPISIAPPGPRPFSLGRGHQRGRFGIAINVVQPKLCVSLRPRPHKLTMPSGYISYSYGESKGHGSDGII